VVRLRPAAAVVVFEPARGVLMIRRHRFITGAQGWEVPAGRVEDGEQVLEAAARETLEETGWRPGSLSLLGSSHPAQGLLDITHHVVLANGAAHEGDPAHSHESSEVAWIPLGRLLPMIEAGEMPDGYSQHALLLARALGRLGG